MKRRIFLQNSILATGGLFFLSGKHGNLQVPDIAIFRGGSPVEMLELGLEILGGIGRFVKEGQRVLIKPTIRWNKYPQSGANTNPDLLAHLVKRCYEAGSKGVYLVEQTEDDWTKCYKTSGIERAVKDAGAKILPGNNEFLYHEVDIPNAEVMKKAKVHEVVQEVDLIINVPAVKPDPKTLLFGAFNNLMGLIWNNESDQNQPIQSMLDFLRYQKPVLNIMDMYRVAQQGIRADQVTTYKSMILSPDIVAAEAYSARRMGIDPNSVTHIELAARAGFGQIDLPKEKVKSIVFKSS